MKDSVSEAAANTVTEPDTAGVVAATEVGAVVDVSASEPHAAVASSSDNATAGTTLNLRNMGPLPVGLRLTPGAAGPRTWP